MRTGSARRTSGEGLKAARLLMVLSSMSPLFLLWAIRGNNLLPDFWFTAACVFMVVFPNIIMLVRIRMAKKQVDKRPITVGKADDHRDHLLVYLFAMLLPFYSETIGTWRDLAATLTALAFIVFLFWHLNLHYMNLLFAVFGYRIYTIDPPDDGNPLTGRSRLVLITPRVVLRTGQQVNAYRISNTVYLEVNA